MFVANSSGTNAREIHRIRGGSNRKAWMENQRKLRIDEAIFSSRGMHMKI